MSVSAFPHANFNPPLVLSVDASGSSINNLRFNNTCYAGVAFQSDENERNNQGSAGDATMDATFIQKYIFGGSAGEVWLLRTINSGSLNSIDPGAGRHQLSTTRKLGIERTSVGMHDCNVTVEFWDAASGGSMLDTVTFDLDVEFTV